MASYNELPKGWNRIPLREAGVSVTGNTPPTKDAENYGGKLPYIKPPQLRNNIFSEGEETLSEKGRSLARVLPPNSVLVSCIGNLGRTGLNQVSVAFNQQINAVIPNSSILPKFLFYQAQSSDFRNQLEEKSTATTISIVNKGSFEKVLINLAPLNEQKNIVAKIEELFSELDSGIASLKTAQQQLKIYRQALLKHAFEGKLTEQWRKDNADKLETPEQLLARIQTERETRYQQQLDEWKQAVKDWEAKGKEGKKPSKPKEIEVITTTTLDTEHYLSGVPKSWLITKAKHLCDFITKGTTPSKENLISNQGEVPFIKVYNLTHKGALDFSIEPTFVSQQTHHGFLARSKVYPNDVLMNIVGPPLGKVSIVPDTYKEWNINQAIAIFRSDSVKSKFLANFLLFQQTVNFMMSQSKATAGQFNLTLEICRDLPMPVPCALEQQEIINQLEEKLSIIEQNEKEIESALVKAELLRQSILKKAFSGKLD